MVDLNHTPVLVSEVVWGLNPQPGGLYVDGTVGGGGHAEVILEKMGEKGRLIGVDCDERALEAARKKLQRFGERATLIHGHYEELSEILAGLGEKAVDGLLLDLGVSSFQLDGVERGFSFLREGPLDMRMDSTERTTAADLLMRLSEKELETVFREYGEERYARRIAREIKKRPRGVLKTTQDLSRLVSEIYPFHHSRIHPATRVFQALRIAVNRETERLDRFLNNFPKLLRAGGRGVFIAYHSLEDRRVKQKLRALKQGGEFRVLTSKPIRPAEREIQENPRARSARLRVLERIAA